jgi:hypothetical protein
MTITTFDFEGQHVQLLPDENKILIEDREFALSEEDFQWDGPLTLSRSLKIGGRDGAGFTDAFGFANELRHQAIKVQWDCTYLNRVTIDFPTLEAAKKFAAEHGGTIS